MKTKSIVVTVATIMLIAHHLGAQGTVNFSTLGVTISDDNGEPIPSGNIFTAGLFYAPVGTTDSFSFEQVGAATGFIGPGIIIAGARQVTDDRTGPFANLQVRVWQSVFTSYEDAAQSVGALVGHSDILTIDVGFPNTISDPPGTVPGLLENGL